MCKQQKLSESSEKMGYCTPTITTSKLPEPNCTMDLFHRQLLPSWLLQLLPAAHAMQIHSHVYVCSHSTTKGYELVSLPLYIAFNL